MFESRSGILGLFMFEKRMDSTRFSNNIRIEKFESEFEFFFDIRKIQKKIEFR